MNEGFTGMKDKCPVCGTFKKRKKKCPICHTLTQDGVDKEEIYTGVKKLISMQKESGFCSKCGLQRNLEDDGKPCPRCENDKVSKDHPYINKETTIKEICSNCGRERSFEDDGKPCKWCQSDTVIKVSKDETFIKDTPFTNILDEANYFTELSVAGIQPVLSTPNTNTYEKPWIDDEDKCDCGLKKDSITEECPSCGNGIYSEMKSVLSRLDSFEKLEEFVINNEGSDPTIYIGESNIKDINKLKLKLFFINEDIAYGVSLRTRKIYGIPAGTSLIVENFKNYYDFLKYNKKKV
jgi:hypothetical protein